MWWPFQLLTAYVLGGLTFLPLVIAAGIYYGLKYGSVPVGDGDLSKLSKSKLQESSERAEVLEKSKTEAEGTTAASSAVGKEKPISGWLTVRRQFKPTTAPSLFSLGTPQTDLSGATVAGDGKAVPGVSPGETSEVSEADSKTATRSGSDTDSSAPADAASASAPIASAAGAAGPGASARSAAPAPTTYSARLAQTYRQVMDSRQTRNSPPKDYFFAVLKGPVLFLYENEDQAECVAAVGVDKYTVAMETVEGRFDGKDGEMFSKRKGVVLRLASDQAAKGTSEEQKKGLPAVGKGMDRGETPAGKDGAIPDMESAPWFFFSKQNIKMEDWFLALTAVSHDRPTTTDVFSSTDMQALVDLIDTEPDPIPLRWLNAMFGRLFLGVHRTKALEDLIIERIMKKLAKVPRPALIGPITIREVNVGSSVPVFSKPMLKELNADGSCAFEVHGSYKARANVPDSGVRIIVALTANIPVGFKTYNVEVVVAVVLKSIEGDMRFFVKKPPSNRVWWAFTQPPKLDVEIVPIVSDRKITMNMVLSAIDKQMRDMINESVVLPNMDDFAFFDTSAYDLRGGIWSSMSRAATDTTKTEESSQKASEAKTKVEVVSASDAVPPANASVAALKKALPAKSQSLLVGVTNSLSGSTATSASASTPDLPAQTKSEQTGLGIARTETAPPEVASGTTAQTGAASAKKRLSALASSLNSGFNSSRESLNSESGLSIDRDHRAARSSFGATDSSGLAKGRPLVREMTSAEKAAAAQSTSQGRGSAPISALGSLSTASLTTDTSSLRSDATASDGSGGTAISPSHETGTLGSAGAPGSTASLIESFRSRDKKAIQSQVNLARDNLKKWGVNFAAKRKAEMKPQSAISDSAKQEDQAKPAPLYRPLEDEADRDAQEMLSGHRRSGSMSGASTSGGHVLGVSPSSPTNSRGKTLKERLEAAAAAAAAAQATTSTSGATGSDAAGKSGTAPSAAQRHRSDTVSSRGSASASSISGAGGARPSLLASPSKSELSKSELSTVSTASVMARRPSSSSAGGSSAPGEPSRRGSHGHLGANPGSTVSMQPSAGRSMVVPRVPKRPGEVTGIGGGQMQGVQRTTSGDGDTPHRTEEKPTTAKGEATTVAASSAAHLTPSKLPARSKSPTPAKPTEEGSTTGKASTDMEKADSAPSAVTVPPPLPPRSPGPVAKAGVKEEPGIHSSEIALAEADSSVPESTPPSTDLVSAIEADLVAPQLDEEDMSKLADTAPLTPAEHSLRELAQRDEATRSRKADEAATVEEERVPAESPSE